VSVTLPPLVVIERNPTRIARRGPAEASAVGCSGDLLGRRSMFVVVAMTAVSPARPLPGATESLFDAQLDVIQFSLEEQKDLVAD
jgi:hypothetical protein